MSGMTPPAPSPASPRSSGGAKELRGGLRYNVIATGGGPGIMEAANRGATDAGAPTIGFNITLPLEQEPNAYSTPELTFRFHYFAMRKMHLAMRASALVVFPGGFGTFDELFELLTLRQTGKMPAIPIALVDRRFWSSVVNFAELVKRGMIGAGDLALFEFADRPEEIWATIETRAMKSRFHGVAAAGNAPAMTLRLEFHGAARTITGSCYVIDNGASRVMFDCGMFQGSKTESELNYRPVSLRARKHRRAGSVPRPHRPHRPRAEARQARLSPASFTPPKQPATCVRSCCRIPVTSRKPRWGS